MEALKIISTDLLTAYLEQVNNLLPLFEQLNEAEISTDSFSFYISVASVYSSKIEGEEIDLDSYIKYKSMGVSFQPDFTKKVDDLYQAYLFAQQNELTPSNISKAHTLLAQNILAKNGLGKLRMQNMYVTTSDGKIEYVAASPYKLEEEMDRFYHDLTILLNQNLSLEQVFYFASYIHLVFVKIHPWLDGNGRSARLVEKWFVAHHLGPKAWFLQSEKYYYLQHLSYYNNIRKLGIEYFDLDFKQALPFLKMLAKSLEL